MSKKVEPQKAGSWRGWWWLPAIFFARIFLFQLFLVPTGSMEPTVSGHRSYGDRILVNQLAYASVPHATFVLVGLAALVLFALVQSVGWRGLKSRRLALVALLSIAALSWCWQAGAIADEPHRFDTVTFDYEPQWSEAAGGRILYVKRVAGLPGETITISGGDLFKRNPQTGRDEILRKWESDRALQDELWYPVSRAWSEHGHSNASAEDLQNLAFPWTGAEPGTPGAKLEPGALVLDGSTPVTLTYKYPATNICLKQGRWPFEHAGCPARTPEMTAYVWGTWRGVQCSACREIIFPVDPRRLKPHPAPDGTNFFAGGQDIVGDLKLLLALELTEPGGELELDVGSNQHRAQWCLPSNPQAATSPQVHSDATPTAPLEVGRHTLALAYVDGTVLAQLDGRGLEPMKIDVPPLSKSAPPLRSIAQVTLRGIRGRVTQLDLYRDLFYTPTATAYRANPAAGITSHHEHRRYYDSDNYVLQIPADHYLMLGDNSPNSADSRLWGFVPRANLGGHPVLTYWPPSRWGVAR